MILHDFTKVVSLIQDSLKRVILHCIFFRLLIWFFYRYYFFSCNGIHCKCLNGNAHHFIELIKLCKNSKYFQILFTFSSSSYSFVRLWFCCCCSCCCCCYFDVDNVQKRAVNFVVVERRRHFDYIQIIIMVFSKLMQFVYYFLIWSVVDFSVIFFLTRSIYQ